MQAIDEIRVRGLSKRYGLHRALGGVDLDLKAGRLCALLGPNGAGKSTLLGILSSIVRPTAGEVTYHHGSERVAGGADLRRHIGVLAHDSFLYGGLTAVENLAFWGRLYAVEDLETRALSLLREVDLDEKAWNLPARTYSRGMTQRLALARTMLHQPSVLLLDEPFTGLDRGGATRVSEALSRAVSRGALALVVTHDLESIADIATHLVVLRRGKIAHQAEGSFGFESLKNIYEEHADEA